MGDLGESQYSTGNFGKGNLRRSIEKLNFESLRTLSFSVLIRTLVAALWFALE
jgi:hypothetical protein